ncbi:EEF1A lysine methyltransferase 2 isoform X1 [Aethina tumida]|uniref:EEF1A lysine methyltransferase 2 isoform X1 n=2 Tax=Aethina tumida TaxID=116153 RepID=UPI0021491808|nr:EEF1A lysine methyltransferase 2 isoform X1 [Aethina tumida]
MKIKEQRGDHVMEELGESELGTHEYWEGRYKTEIKNFTSHGDPGEIWFGEDIVDRIIRWLQKQSTIPKDCKLVDIGCGNGMFLIELANEGYSNLYGTDYSEEAIKLAVSIAEKNNVSVRYFQHDITESFTDTYKIVHDKGTYDAISLSKESADNRRKYINNVHSCLEDDGYLIITSCNWTESELQEHFKDSFVIVEAIPTPQFKFGGKVGNVVTSIVFKKK